MAGEKIRGIVTDIVRHSDRNNIVTLFTRSRGRVSFVSATGAGKGGRMRNARLQPLAVIEADITFRENRDLQLLGSFRVLEVWRELYFHPVKTSLVMFLSEFLHRYLKESQPDPYFWDFVVGALRELDRGHKGIANFHLAFMTRMMDFAGILPDVLDWERGDWFDMRSGMIVAERPSHPDQLNPEQTGALQTLLRMDMRNYPLYRFNSTQRREFLRELLHYYGVHFPGISNLRSPEVLAEIWEG